MIDKLSEWLTKKIRLKMPEVTDEEEEVILYGIQLIVGEIPKVFFMFLAGFLLGLWWQTVLAFFLLIPYKAAAGGFHLKSHLGCFLFTNIVYCGNAYLSTILTFPNPIVKWGIALATWIIGLVCITKYAPADTVNLPILTKKERQNKKILSYLFLSLNIAAVVLIPNTVIANIILIGTMIETISITKIAYIVTKNEYGYEVYQKQLQQEG